MDDYIRMVRVFVSLCIEKVRITGGEPLLRKELLHIVGELAALPTTSGTPLDVAITTNGHLLANLARQLKDAGLSRITVSMDAVDRDKFARITRVSNGYDAVVGRNPRRQTSRPRTGEGERRHPAQLQRRSDRSLRPLFPR